VRMLQDVRAGNLKKWSSTDVALVVAGVSAEERPSYEEKLNEITAEAYEVTKDATTPEKKAKKLAKFLHDGPMKAGYVTGQYNLKVLLDTGTYNCVSSALLFDIIGRRLGLKVETVNIPRHIFCRLGSIDIEPTSGRVYPASIRGERVGKKRQEKDDKSAVYGDRLFRETTSRSLQSEPDYDEGCDFEHEKKYDRAVISFLKAATIEPGNPLPATELNKSMKNWFNETLQKRRFSQAAAIAKLYRQMLKDPSAAAAMDTKLKAARKAKAA
jgi:Transglutaminase-like superfamily